MPLKGCGYRWVARRRMIARKKREHRQNAMQDLQELRQRIFGLGDTVTPELRKKAMAEVRVQSKKQVMEFRQQPQASRDSLPPQDGFSHEIVHNLTPSELRAITNLKLRESLRES